MILDESTISDALHEATSDLTVTADLAARVRGGGRRRLRRRRISAAVGVTAVVAALVPAAIALSPGNGSRQTLGVAGGPGSWRSVLHLPAAQSCSYDAGDGGSYAVAASYPQLLMLPRDVPVTYAFTNTGGAPRCSYFPHVALTLLHEDSGTAAQGVEVEGPNAPSAEQDGYGGSDGGQFGGAILHPQVDGQPATVFYTNNHSPANVFWSGTAGDQWHATVRGFSQSALDKLLGDLRVDPKAGTATLPGAAAGGWTVAPPAPDASGDTSGVFYALWHEGGSRISLYVAPGPNRVDQYAAAMGDPQFVTVQGRPAVLGGHSDTGLWWQVGDNVTAYLTMTHSSPAQIQQIAATIVPISPSDPRLHRP